MSFASPQILKHKSTGASIFVLACIDPRFTEFLGWFLTHQAQVHSDFDQFNLAGASLGAIQSLGKTNPTAGGPAWPISSTSYPNTGNWGGVLMDHISLATQLHGIREVWVFEHLDCGAYKNFQFIAGSTDLNPSPHIANMVVLQNYIATFTNTAVPAIQTAVRALSFKGFVMSLDGSITLSVNDGNGMTLQVSKSLDSYNILIGTLISLLVVALGATLYLANKNTLLRK